MKYLYSIIIVLALLVGGMVGGCTEALLLGGGVAAGGALSNTIAGAEKDLEAREQKLIDDYNKGVEQGMKKESLDQIEQDIIDTRLAKQTVSEGKGLLNVDWKDPKQTGPAVGTAIALAYAWLNRKKRITTETALKEVVIGGEGFKANGGTTFEDFKKAQNTAQSNETKKMVAVLRV